MSGGADCHRDEQILRRLIGETTENVAASVKP